VTATPEPVQTANKLGSIRVRAVPVPENIRKFLVANEAVLRRLASDKPQLEGDTSAQVFSSHLEEEFKQAGSKWSKEFSRIWSFGPRRFGPNILLNHIPGYKDSGNQLVGWRVDALLMLW
jgi:ribosome assembly protein 1